MQWENKYQTRVKQDYTFALNGTMIYKNIDVPQGLSITLSSLSDAGWMKKSTLDAIVALANDLTADYPLEVHDKTYRVIFNHKEGAIEATSVFPTSSNPSADTFYLVKLSFLILEDL